MKKEKVSLCLRRALRSGIAEGAAVLLTVCRMWSTWVGHNPILSLALGLWSADDRAALASSLLLAKIIFE